VKWTPDFEKCTLKAIKTFVDEYKLNGELLIHDFDHEIPEWRYEVLKYGTIVTVYTVIIL